MRQSISCVRSAPVGTSTHYMPSSRLGPKRRPREHLQIGKRLLLDGCGGTMKITGTSLGVDDHGLPRPTLRRPRVNTKVGPAASSHDIWQCVSHTKIVQRSGSGSWLAPQLLAPAPAYEATRCMSRPRRWWIIKPVPEVSCEDRHGLPASCWSGAIEAV